MQKLNLQNTSLVLATALVASAFALQAKADVTWNLQPSTSVTFGGTMTNVIVKSNLDGNGQAKALSFSALDANGNYVSLGSTADIATKGIVTKGVFKAVPQTDPGTSYPAANSMLGTANGHYKTVGSNFLSSLDFGGQTFDLNASGDFPAKLASLGMQVANNGNWLPDKSSAGNDVGDYGSATPANSAFTLVPANPVNPTNYPLGVFSDGTAGRAALFGLASEVMSPNVNGTTVTIPVANGVFNPTEVKLAGSLGFAINFVGANDDTVHGTFSDASNAFQLALPPNIFAAIIGGGDPTSSNLQLGVVDNTINANVGSITRGALNTPNQSKFFMTSPFQTHITLLLADPGSLAITVSPGTSASGAFLDLTVDATTVGMASLRPGNINFDNTVDISDVQLVAQNFGQHNAARIGPGDANGDGVVDISDIQLIAQNFGQPNPGSGNGSGGNIVAVPEPGSLVLLGIGGVIGLAAARRRKARR